jgi:hypothetical protein
MDNKDNLACDLTANVTVAVDMDGRIIGLGRLSAGRVEAQTLRVAVLADEAQGAAKQVHRLQPLHMRLADSMRRLLRPRRGASEQ